MSLIYIRENQRHMCMCLRSCYWRLQLERLLYEDRTKGVTLLWLTALCITFPTHQSLSPNDRGGHITIGNMRGVARGGEHILLK